MCQAFVWISRSLGSQFNQDLFENFLHARYPLLKLSIYIISSGLALQIKRLIS